MNITLTSHRKITQVFEQHVCLVQITFDIGLGKNRYSKQRAYIGHKN